MTKLFATTLLNLSLTLLVGCSSAQPQPIPPCTEVPTSKVEQCSLVPCPLPELTQPKANEDWTVNQRILEKALTYCATQVLECIKTQQVKPTTK